MGVWTDCEAPAAQSRGNFPRRHRRQKPALRRLSDTTCAAGSYCANSSQSRGLRIQAAVNRSAYESEQQSIAQLSRESCDTSGSSSWSDDDAAVRKGESGGDQSPSNRHVVNRTTLL
ncbi:unnamed protein product [Lota lota]